MDTKFHSGSSYRLRSRRLDLQIKTLPHSSGAVVATLQLKSPTRPVPMCTGDWVIEQNPSTARRFFIPRNSAPCSVLLRARKLPNVNPLAEVLRRLRARAAGLPKLPGQAGRSPERSDCARAILRCVRGPPTTLQMFVTARGQRTEQRRSLSALRMRARARRPRKLCCPVSAESPRVDGERIRAGQLQAHIDRPANCRPRKKPC